MTLQHACIKALKSQVGKKTHENQGKLKKLMHSLCIGNYFVIPLKVIIFTAEKKIIMKINKQGTKQKLKCTK